MMLKFGGTGRRKRALEDDMVNVLFVEPTVAGRRVNHVFSMEFVFQIVMFASNPVNENDLPSSEWIFVIPWLLGISLVKKSVFLSCVQSSFLQVHSVVIM
jgi:hypothetical protein